MWVKICGNTNLQDAQLAADLGADAVGFIFAASKRQVSAEQVARITSALEMPVERVGVFDSHDASEIVSTALTAGLSAVQLHGGFNEGLLARVSEGARGRLSIIQTLHWTVGQTAEDTLEQLQIQLAAIASLGVTDRVLIDSKLNGFGGGTGVAFDWLRARELFAAQRDRGVRLVLAGGLKPENVTGAIQELEPWGVDVSSGVEFGPGKKNPERVLQFIRNARHAG
jgi:phosphoribosylanthranilate isomerase